MTSAEGRPEFSVVAPVRNESANVEALIQEISQALGGRAF
ncbi:MAG: dolichol-phosphate mannosyltransferase, partial [Alphaproteobacteria bacterium]